jgi:hypothetical protein
MGTPTANKNLIIPTLNGDFGTWGSEINGDISTLDLNLGGSQAVSIAGNTNVIATLAESQYMFTLLTGLLTGNVSYILPPVGGFYVIFNGSTGAHTVTIACAGGGTSIVIPQGTSMSLACDGVNIVSATSAYVVGGAVVTTSNLSTTGSATIGTTLSVGSTLAVAGGVAFNSTLGVVGAATIGGLVTSNGGFISTTPDAGGAQFRAIGGGYGMLLRNDGANAYLLSTPSGAPFGSFNTIRPFSWNLANGAVAIDGGGSGTTHGGPVSVATTLFAAGAISSPSNIIGGGLISTGAASVATSLSVGGAMGIGGGLTVNGPLQINNNVASTLGMFAINFTASSTVTGLQLTSTGNINAAGAIVASGAVITSDLVGTIGTLGGAVFPGSGTINGNLITGADLVASIGTLGGVVFPGGSTINTTGQVQFGANAYVNGDFFVGYTGGGFGTKNGLGAGNSIGYPNIFNVWWDGTSVFIYIDSTPIVIGGVSDARAKQDVVPMADDALGRIKALNPVSYRHKKMGIVEDGEAIFEGLLAQEVRKIIPSAVNGDESKADDILSISANPIIATLIKGLQELAAQVEAQAGQLVLQDVGMTAQNSRLRVQDARLSKLEAMIIKPADDFRVDL